MHDAVLYFFLFLGTTYVLFGRRAAAILFAGVIVLMVLFAGAVILINMVKS
jgi:hypothetical protein